MARQSGFSKARRTGTGVVAYLRVYDIVVGTTSQPVVHWLLLCCWLCEVRPPAVCFPGRSAGYLADFRTFTALRVAPRGQRPDTQPLYFGSNSTGFSTDPFGVVGQQIPTFTFPAAIDVRPPSFRDVLPLVCRLPYVQVRKVCYTAARKPVVIILHATQRGQLAGGGGAFRQHREHIITPSLAEHERACWEPRES